MRLRRKEDFAHLRKTGRVWRHPFLILSVAPNQLAHNRYGFVTSKRLGKAVTRTLTRRLLREAIRRLHPVLAPGYDLVLIARAPIVGQPYQAICEAVQSCLQQTELWPPPGSS
ncbi:MAG: ribonuclease P protein component [Anaerolineae bacterium]|nr:ribonuclease P protein component [Anaerolineae bacterium]